jgi:tetratricopeptide (TPR) repeat protein
MISAPARAASDRANGGWPEVRDRDADGNPLHVTQMRLDEAEDWYRKSLVINEQLSNRPGTAVSYHDLGMIAEDQGRLDEAEDWYRKSQAINEELGIKPRTAGIYHRLGSVAEDRGRLDEAEDWYRKSLVIKEELGDRHGIAVSYGQLGLLAEQRGQPRQAMEWTVRCVSLFGEFLHSMTGPAPLHLARLTNLLGVPALEQSWRQVTGHPVPQAVLDYITSHRDE